MSSGDSDIMAALHAQLRVLSDRAEIGALCDRYVMHLDRDRDNDGWRFRRFAFDLMWSAGEVPADRKSTRLNSSH